VAGRCDDTVDKKRVNSCEIKHLFLREFGNQKHRERKAKIFNYFVDSTRSDHRLTPLAVQDDDARVLNEEERRGRLAMRLKARGLALAAPTYLRVFLLLPAARGRVP